MWTLDSFVPGGQARPGRLGLSWTLCGPFASRVSVLLVLRSPARPLSPSPAVLSPTVSPRAFPIRHLSALNLASVPEPVPRASGVAVGSPLSSFSLRSVLLPDVQPPAEGVPSPPGRVQSLIEGRLPRGRQWEGAGCGDAGGRRRESRLGDRKQRGSGARGRQRWVAPRRVLGTAERVCSTHPVRDAGPLGV